MMDKAIYILFLWIFNSMLPLWCSGQLHPMDDVKNNVHSEDVLKNLLGVLDFDGKVPEHGSFPPPPQYMLELYQTYSGSDPDENLRYNTANIVRSFSNKDESADNGHYFFDLKDAISNYEEIISAEFRFFIHRNMLGMQQTSDVTKVQLYEGQGNEASRLLEERIVSGNNSDWEVFSVKSSTEKWFYNPNLNKGFTVKVANSSGHKLSNERIQKDEQSVLIVFSRNPKITKFTSSTQVSSSSESHSGEINQGGQYSSRQENVRNARSVSETEKDLCKRYEFRIDFGELGWLPWILAPEWYNAYACKGACAFGKNQNTTSHARMQSLVHHLGLSSNKGTPCCVPTELQPLSILLYDKNSNTVLAKFDDMVATDCGCR